jgi:hypothetical protein
MLRKRQYPNNQVYLIKYSLKCQISTMSHLICTVVPMDKLSAFTMILKIYMIGIRSCIYVEIRS